jgi:hypothetical protein
MQKNPKEWEIIDHAQSLHENTDVAYRISGRNVFLKTPDGHEIKTLRCDLKDNATVCGDDIFPHLGIPFGDQARNGDTSSRPMIQSVR